MPRAPSFRDVRKLIKLGRAKAWLVHRKTGALALCVPKLARENLLIKPGQRFCVLLDPARKRLIYEKMA